MDQFSQSDIEAELARRQSSSSAKGQDFSSNANFQQLSPYVSEVEQKYGLPQGLLANTAGAESSWNPNAINPDSGATGLMQFMPATAKSLGIDPRDPMQSIDAAGKYYQHLIQKNGGDVPKAVAQYGGFVTKDPSDYQAKVIPQGYYASNQQPLTANPQPVVSDASPYSQEEIQAELDRRTAAGDEGFEQRGEFNKGVRRSIADTANLMENALPAFGKSAANELFGTDFDNKQDLIDYAQKSSDISKEFPAQVGSISDIKSASDIVPYFAGIMGENAAGLIPVIGEGYVGAKLIAPMMTDMAENAASKYMARGAFEGEAKDLAAKEVAAKMGALTVVGAMAPQQMAGEYMNLMSKGQDDPMGAALIGGLEAGIYALPGMEIMNNVLGKLGSEAATKSVADGVGAETRTLAEKSRFEQLQQTLRDLGNHPAVAEAAKTAAYLGATGMASESIGVLGEGILGANPDILSKDNFTRIINSGISNAVGGAIVGGVTGLAHGPKPDILNLPGANKEQGNKRTTLDTGEVLATKAKPTEEGQLEANLQAPNGETLEQANPATSNLLDPSLLRPSQMSAEHHALADKFGVTTETLRFATDPHPTDAAKKAALDELFKVMTPTDPRQGDLALASDGQPLDFEARVKSIMTQRPDLERPYAEAVVEKQLQRNFADRDKQLSQEGAKFNEDGTLERTSSAQTLDDRSPWIENPEIKVGVHDNTKAAEGVDDLVGKTQTQAKVDESPAYGNLHSDIKTPVEVTKHLAAIELKPEAKAILTPVIKEINRIIKEVAGSAATFVPAERLIQLGRLNDTIAGCQFGGYIMTAMPDYFVNHEATKNGKVPRELVENAYHEAAHTLFNHIFSEADKLLIRRNSEKLRPYFMQDGYLSEGNFDAYLDPSHPEGLDELFANAVGKEGAKRYFLEQDQMKGIPFILRPFVKKIMDVYNRTRDAIRGATVVKSMEDLMHSVVEGKYASDHIRDGVTAIQRDRLGRILLNFQKVLGREHDAAMDEALDTYNGLGKTAEELKTMNANRDTNPKNMSLTGALLSSFRWLADKYPVFTPQYNEYKEAQAKARDYMGSWSGSLDKGFNQLPKEDRYLTHSILDAVSKSDGGKIRFNSEGHALIPYDSSSMKDLPFDHTNLKDGDVVPLKDPDLAKGLKALQDTYKSVLDGRAKEWKSYVSKSFKDIGLPEDFSKSDLEAAKLKLNPEEGALYKEKLDRLTRASADIDGLAKMRTKEYVPRQRYGQHAYIVKYKDIEAHGDKAGKTAGLFSVENGFFSHAGRVFDKNSLAKAQGNLKKYLDRPDLYNVYDNNGRISKDAATGNYRDIAHPVLLNYDDVKNHYGLNGDNLEIMAGFLNSRGVDMSAFDPLRDLVSTKVNGDKFSRMFKPSEKLDGYSQDWDRVLHSYLTSSAHFLGNMEFNRNLPAYQRLYSKILDPQLRDRAEKHFGKPGERGYVNSGQSDFGNLRTINYLWCMGGNMSSLLVEMTKVPTATLGNLNQFRPNSLKNMATLGKFSKRYYTALNKIWNARSQFGGHLITPLHNEDFLNHITGGDKEMNAFIKDYAAKYGNITEASANRAFGGGEQFGTETGKSNFQSKTNKIQTWLTNPLSVVEQGNRLISFCANYEVMKELEQHQPGKLDQILQKNQIYQDMRQRNPDWKPWQAGTMYAVDEENGAPGKIDRSPYLQGVGGAFIQPFFSFDHQMLEGMIKMFNRGPEGKKALGVMLGSIALLAGIQGLPGARLLMKGGQALQNSITGTDPDWEQAIRESMTPVVGARNSLMVTNGLLRAYGGMEISQRISLPLPGEDLLLNLLGVEAGKTSSVLGVEGSMIQNASNAWRGYMNGQSASASLGQMLPNSIGNLERAYQLTQRGAMNNVGGQATRAVPPDQMSNWSVISRALGITSDQIASANEQIYAQKMKGKELQTADHRFTQQAENALMSMQDAQKQGNTSAALDAQQKLIQVVKNKAAFAAEHKVPFNGASFLNQLTQSSIQRQMPLGMSKQNLGGKTGLYNGSLGTYQYFTDLRGDDHGK